MSVYISNDREVNVGDEVTLIGKRWYINDHTFNVGDKMTIVADNCNSQYYMNIKDGVITVEIDGVRCNSGDFE